jgi:hypothetical protein
LAITPGNRLVIRDNDRIGSVLVARAECWLKLSVTVRPVAAQCPDCASRDAAGGVPLIDLLPWCRGLDVRHHDAYLRRVGNERNLQFALFDAGFDLLDFLPDGSGNILRAQETH